MNNEYIIQARNEIHRDPFWDEIGMEGYTGFTDFVKSMVDGLTGKKSAVLNPDNLIFKSRYASSSLLKKMGNVDFSALGPITVYQPVGFMDHITPYATYLNGLIERLADVSERLYEPLISYFEGALSQPEKVNAIWIDRNLRFVGHDHESKTLGQFFNPKVDRAQTTNLARFDELYPSVSSFQKAGEALKVGEGMVAKVDLPRLNRRQDTLSDVVNRYVEIAGEMPELVTSNRQNIKRLVEVLQAIVAESELLAIAVYHFNTLHNAYFETVKKLDENLK